MKSYFCPCVLVGQNHARIHKGTQKEDACSGWCAGWCGLTSCLGLGWILQMMDRMEMQDKHSTAFYFQFDSDFLTIGNRSRRRWLWCLLQVLLVWMLLEHPDVEGIGLYSASTTTATGRLC
jgi:hypothetical protein